MNFESVEEAARHFGVSERQGWRWLKKGKLRKVKGEDGRVLFALVTDANVTEVSHDVSHDRQDRSPGQTGGKVTGAERSPRPAPADTNRSLIILELNEKFFELNSWVRRMAPAFIDLGQLYSTVPGYECYETCEQWAAVQDNVESWYRELQSDHNVNRDRLRSIFHGLLGLQEWLEIHVFGGISDDGEYSERELRDFAESKEALRDRFREIFQCLKTLISS